MTGKRIQITGTVQGVGFRPFVFNLAHRYGITGSVKNDTDGVDILAAGDRVDPFIRHIRENPPPLARIDSFTVSPYRVSPKTFTIVSSESSGQKKVDVGVDTAVCPDCLAEMRDPANRRYRYPFINCINCGPRYTLVCAVPYDRPNTAMAPFPMCPECADEYRNPRSRRFHCQSNCCPHCGPSYTGLDRAVAVLLQGGIVAIKGVGGYHLACRADSPDAVLRLRKRKHRDEKPFAVMAADVSGFNLTPEQHKLLHTIERPIVLIDQDEDQDRHVAPGLKTLGLMLPYAPVHHLLFELGGFGPLVMTSGNTTDEPMAVENGKERLGHIADFVLDHNRAIVVRNDDSVVREMNGTPVFLRRSRGYAPAPVSVGENVNGLLACGALLKNTIAVGRNDQAVLSQYIGDLNNEAAYSSLQTTSKHLLEMYDIRLCKAVCDRHPAYLSTRFAETLGVPVVRIQHHVAHACACMAENGLKEALAVVYDGAGFGDDGRTWGGEIFLIRNGSVQRIHHLSYIPLAGGDACVQYPLRTAAGALYSQGIRLPGLAPVYEMLDKQVNVHLSSGMGRLFDAAAAITGLCEKQSYEGQGPMRLEAASAPLETAGEYEHGNLDSGLILAQLYKDRAMPEIRAARFHNTLIKATIAILCEAWEETGINNVCLTGGCFQNLLLTNGLCGSRECGLRFFVHRRVPANDSGIAYGQLAAAAFLKE